MENQSIATEELTKLKRSKKFNKQSGSQWTDDKGMLVDTKRISKLEKVREKHGSLIGAKALKIEELLQDLRFAVNGAIAEIRKELIVDAGTETLDMKGHTFYNFDRTVKIFRQVSPIIDYDEGKMQTAREAFSQFVTSKMGDDENQIFLKDMIMSAFTTTRGKFDTRKINTLLAQRDNAFVAEDPDFQNAIRLVIEAKVTKEEKVYDQVYVKNPESGEYEAVNLNLASLI